MSHSLDSVKAQSDEYQLTNPSTRNRSGEINLQHDRVGSAVRNQL